MSKSLLSDWCPCKKGNLKTPQGLMHTEENPCENRVRTTLDKPRRGSRKMQKLANFDIGLQASQTEK